MCVQASHRELQRLTADFLRQARAADPRRFREVAHRHPVLSTWQIDRRRRQETALGVAEDGRDLSPAVARLLYRRWQQTLSDGSHHLLLAAS
jgi:hypothetical protein